MIDREKIKHLALLSKLKLDSEQEVEKLYLDLKNILTYVDKIKSLNFSDEDLILNLKEKIEPREDEVIISGENYLLDNQESQILIKKNFPELKDNYLKVPKILEKDE